MILFAAALSAAESLEGRAGPRAALPAYRTLAGSASEPERSRAILGLLRVGVASDDRAALEEGIILWASAEGAHFDRVRPLVLTLAKKGRADVALALAQVEAGRTRRPLAHYLVARLASEHRPDLARAAFEEARARAQAEGDDSVYHASTCRLLALLPKEASEEAAALAGSVDVTAVPPRQRLAVAAALLGAKSRFRRASGLTLLQELLLAAKTDGSREAHAVAARALALAAKSADRLLAAATPLERERLEALFAAAPDPALRARLLARLGGDDDVPRSVRPTSKDPAVVAAFLRAKDAVAGLPPSDAPSELAGAVLAAVAHLAAKRPEATEFALTRAARALANPDVSGASRPLAALLRVTLTAEQAPVRLAAVRLAVLFAHALAAGRLEPPPGGVLALAQLLPPPAPDDDPILDAARQQLHHAAVRAGEPGAAEALTAAFVGLAWVRAAKDPALALTLLREAQATATPPGK